MEAKDKLLIELISRRDQRFLIPSYQRKYKWNTKNEVKELLEDLEEFVLEKQRDFFLGACVIKSNQNIDRELVLVDGQQRITTFLLILAAIYDIVKEEKNEWKYEISKLLKSDSNKLKLKRMDDEEILKKILTGKVNFLSSLEKQSNYYVVYRFLRKYFMNKTLTELEKFFEKALVKINLAVINLNDNEDEFSVYESINSKGTMLSSSDLIKNYIMMNIDGDYEFEDFFENNFLNKFAAEEIEDFYRQFLALQTGHLYSKSKRKLYYGFKEKYPKENINQLLIGNLKKEGEIWKWIRNQNFSCLTYPIIKTNLLNYYTIIHTLVSKNCIYQNYEIITSPIQFKIIEQSLIRLASVAIRRMLFGAGRVESNRTFASFGHKYYTEDWTFEKVLSELSTTEGNARTPSWEEIENEVLKTDLYTRHKDILKWTLIALEEIKAAKKITYDDITIEHIYPKNPHSNWKLSEIDKAQMANALNTLGNLSITKDNSRLGNNWFTRKKEILADKSYLKINKMIYQFLEWNYQTLKKRAFNLLEEIKNNWKI